MGNLILIKDATGASAGKATAPQAIENRLNAFRQAQVDRRAALKLMLCGLPFRTAAKRHPGREDGLTRDIRAAFLEKDVA